jgi:hypothetical protein
MAKTASYEYHAKLLEDNGVVRGRIPAPLIRDLGGRAGDYLIFKTDGSGTVNIGLEKPRKQASRSTTRTPARATTRSAKKR